MMLLVVHTFFSSYIGYCDDGVPPWEKKFCRSIGSVPWWKVVAAKKYTFCHSNILSWDDSAGEEAFQNAKKRFWAKINGLPCDILLPDPDTYIDKINWNPIIDLELIEDLESAYFVPEEAENDSNIGHRNKMEKNSESLPPEERKQNPDTVANPWESSNYNAWDSDILKNGSQGWSHWNSDSDMLRNSNNEENGWLQNSPQENKAAKDATWRHCSEKVWDRNQGTNNVKQTGGWDKNDNQWGLSCKDKWRDNHGDNSWGLKWQEQKIQRSDRVHGEQYLIPDRGAPKDIGWGDRKGNAWSGGDMSKSYRNPKILEIQKVSQALAACNRSYQKREHPNQYRADCKSSRFRRG